MPKKTAIIFLIIIFSFFCRGTFSQDNNEELADIWFQMGVKFYDIGYYQDAVDRFKTCLSFNPGHKGANKYLDLIGQSQGQEIVNTSQYQETGSILKEESVEEIEKVVERYTAVDMGVETIKKIQKQAKIIRRKLISKTLDDAVIEIDIEYQLAYGEQVFTIIDLSSGQRISKLEYPIEGRMTILNGEWRFHPRFSIGGRYGSSSFRETTVIDTDWVVGLPSVIWWQSNSTGKTKMDFFDLNIYYRLLDLDKSQMSEKFSSFLLLDRFSLDIFGGYQQQTGRYGDTNLVDVIEWWTPVNNPIAGLDSFYKIRYKGPRLGVRFKGWVNDKFSSKIAFSYALIETEAYGWWNLRDLTFWHNGDDGFAYNIDAEVTYNLTPNWFIGLGFHYMKYRQKELTETRILPGYSHYDLDVVRDANNKVYGPSFRVGYMW